MPKNPLDHWLYQRFSRTRLHRINYLSIWFMLAFTLLFSLLVIHEEYKQFRSTIEIERARYIEREHEAMQAAAHRMERIFAFAYERSGGVLEADFHALVELFETQRHQWVMLYDALSAPALPRDRFDGQGAKLLHVTGEQIAQHELLIHGRMESLLLLHRPLGGGYHLLLSHLLEPFEAQMQRQERELRARLIKLVLEVVTLSFILFGFIWAITKVLSALIERDIDAFLAFFAQGKEGRVQMKSEELFFDEFRSMSHSANAMMQTIDSQKLEFETLNASLEERVRSKTQMLQNLFEAQKRFIRHAIHETNTPLSVIMANIELYAMKHGRNRYLAKIEASIKQVFNIYDDLSYLVKKDLVEYPKKQIDLGEFVASRLRFFEEVSQMASHELYFEPRFEGVLHVQMNETKLQRIIDNNLTNAIKYTLRGEPIMVSLSAANAVAQLGFESRSHVIKDTRKIFEAYYREARFAEGFGLGLDLVKSICDEEGIEIEIHSDETRTQFIYRLVCENSAA